MGGIFMAVTRKAVLGISEQTKFAPEIIEKVLRLITILNEINENPGLKNKFALKGGTALNLFVLALPRLSVDIDLNYIGTLNVAEMKAEKSALEKTLRAICARLGMNMQPGPPDHAGGKWNIQYSSVLGRIMNTIQIDINFMYRAPLWPIQLLDSCVFGDFSAKQFPVLSSCELYAGKLRALLSRRVSRDLYDASKIAVDIDKGKLRLALVIYGAMNPKDWRTVSIDSVTCSAIELKERLLPLLNFTEQPKSQDLEEYSRQLVESVKANLAQLFPLTDKESEFVRLVREDGIINSSLITDNTQLASIIEQHPSLLWRASKAGQ